MTLRLRGKHLLTVVPNGSVEWVAAVLYYVGRSQGMRIGLESTIHTVVGNVKFQIVCKFWVISWVWSSLADKRILLCYNETLFGSGFMHRDIAVLHHDWMAYLSRVKTKAMHQLPRSRPL